MIYKTPYTLGSATGIVVSGIIKIGSKVAGELIKRRKLLEAQSEAAVTAQDIAIINAEIAEIDSVLANNQAAVKEYEAQKQKELLYSGLAIGGAALIGLIIFFK